MLSINPISGAGQANYYLSLTQENYYLSSHESPGVYWGEGAKALGLPKTVDSDTLHRLLRGFSADGTAPLVQNAGRADRKAGDDGTFSAPKAVSILREFAPAEFQRQISEEHQAAIHHALAQAESKAAFTRRGHGGTRLEPVGLTVALFEHHTSRNLDPQLHTHCLFLNVGVLANGETRSLHSKPLYEMKMALGASYREELARRLEANLGLHLTRTRDSFEIEGLPKSLCDAFSTRRKEIVAALAEKGIYSAKAAKVAAVATRLPKTVKPRQELTRAWEVVAREHGFGWEAAAKLLERAAERIRPAVEERAPARATIEPKPELTVKREADSARDLPSEERGKAPQETPSLACTVHPASPGPALAQSLTLRLDSPKRALESTDSPAKPLRAPIDLKRDVKREDQVVALAPSARSSAWRQELKQQFANVRPAAVPGKSHPVPPPDLRLAPEAHQREGQADACASVGTVEWCRNFYGRVLFKIPFTCLQLRLVPDRVFYRAPNWSPLRNWAHPRLVLRRADEPAWPKRTTPSNIIWGQRLGPVEVQFREQRLVPNAPAWSPLAGVRTKVVRIVPWDKPHPPRAWEHNYHYGPMR